MEPTTKGANLHPQKRNKTGLVIFILIFLAAAGFAAWKYLLPMLNKRSSSDITMKTPDVSSIRNTEKYGTIPVNQLGIILKEGKTKQDAKKLAELVNGTITGEIELINFYQIETKASTEQGFNRAFKQLQESDVVELVSPNSLLTVDKFDESKGTCNPLDDPMYQDTSTGRNFAMIGLKNAYDYIKASGLTLNPVKVAVLDTRLFKPCDELGGSSNVSTTEADDYNDEPDKDKFGKIKNGGYTHGTMVNEVLGANADNGGVTGVASPLGDKLTIKSTNISFSVEFMAVIT